jgi:hypothetical protein
MEAPLLVEELLQAHHIALTDLSPCRHYTTCPECSAQRSHAHRKLKCLGVTIEAEDKVFWGCDHSGWPARAQAQRRRRKELTAYVYRDKDRVARFRKVRNQPGRPGPRSWLQQSDGRGGWTKGTKGVDTGILYRGGRGRRGDRPDRERGDAKAPPEPESELLASAYTSRRRGALAVKPLKAEIASPDSTPSGLTSPPIWPIGCGHLAENPAERWDAAVEAIIDGEVDSEASGAGGA